MPKLTKTIVDNAKAPAKGDAWVWDSEVEGFGIRIQASGRKVYVVRYRVKDSGTQRKQTLARCSDMPPDKARDMARKVFAMVAEGFDPLGARREVDESPTVAELEVRYTKEHAKPRKKPRSVELDEKNWRLHILPKLGTKRVKEVSEADILTLVGSLSEKPATANQVLALLSKAFNLAEKWKWRPRNTNPCHEVEKYAIAERELILSHEQVKRLGQSLNTMVDECMIEPAMADLFRLLMLTGCRLREIMHAEMAWIDQERSLLLLPDSKVGQRKIPLAPTSMAIIASMPAGQVWLIPGRDGDGPMITPYKAWSRIKKHAGLPAELRIHDLRHTAGSLGHMAGLTQKQIQIMLGHKQMSTTERYLHGAGDEAAVAETMSNVIAGNWGQKVAA